MRYRDAKKLRNEDEVITKLHNIVLTVVSIDVRPKDVLILCDDGNTYHHTELK